MQKTTLACLISALCMGYQGMAFAEETQDLQDETVEQLETIVVSDQAFSQQIGTQKITQEEIERRPATNGNITDLLKTNPNVRFSATSENSNTSGEIKPSEVSFHGEKYYNNNFILNGMSNNDNMNPGSDTGSLEARQPSGTNAYDLPGGDTQSFWVDTSLLKSVEVFDSNISAKYGNFTGGVVDAKLKDPDFEKWNSGKVYYRRTQSAWAQFHTDNDAFEKATRLDFQPEYTKEQYGLMVNQKINEKLSLRFNYTKTQSDITYYQPDLRYRSENGTYSDVGSEKLHQKRLAETYMLNGVYLPDNGDLIRATLMYSPHKSKFYKRNVENSAFTNTGGGVQANIEWEKQFDAFTMTSYFGYKQSGNKIKHDANDYSTFQSSPNIGWISNNNGISVYGGYGKFEDEKNIYTAKQNFEFKEFDFGPIQHKFIAGWQVDLAKAKYRRHADSTNYTYESTRADNRYDVVCNGAEACIDGDQYAWKKIVYYARDVKADDNTYSAYVEDNMTWKRLSFSAGLRYDYKQFSGRHNLAPRLSGSYDIFGDQSTRVFAGYNRYYADTLLAYKLRQQISNYLTYQRNQYADGTLGDWLAPGLAYNNNVNVSDLKTPYSDEYVLGLGQKLFSLNWTFKWVHRNGKDQLLSKTITTSGGQNYTGLTNDGWSKNDTFTITVSPEKSYQWKYATVGWDAGFSYNRTKTNSRWYGANEFNTNDYVIYNNQLYYSQGGLSPTDFNNPYQVFLNINTYFPQWRLSWDQRFSYIGGKDYIYSGGTFTCNGTRTTGENRTACGSYVGPVDLYKDAHQASHFLLDWRFAYKQPVGTGQNLEFTLDVNNVLNRKAVAKSAEGNSVYKMGRNFWFGASYSW